MSNNGQDKRQAVLGAIQRLTLGAQVAAEQAPPGDRMAIERRAQAGHARAPEPLVVPPVPISTAEAERFANLARAAVVERDSEHALKLFAEARPRNACTRASTSGAGNTTACIRRSSRASLPRRCHPLQHRRRPRP